MPFKEKKHGCPNVPLDKISNLPDHVLNDILICLPLHDVVRTSVLSKKWRYKWCRLPQFELDKGTLYEGNLVGSPVHFTNFMYQILALNEGPITKFTLCTEPFEIDYFSKIDNFIYFLSRNGIQHLLLRFSILDSYVLPSSLFACSQLRHLTLEKCSLQLHPHDFKGFDRLISLELHFVSISSKDLESLISHCPLLEHLSFFYIECGADINAPSLRSFDYRGSINLTSLCLKNVPHLEKLSLMDHEWSFMNAKKVCEIAKFFESLSSVKHLHMDNKFVYPSRAGEVLPTRLPFVLHSVQQLCLSTTWFTSYFSRVYPLDGFLFVLCLMRSFPCLQYLEITVSYLDDLIPAPITPEVLEEFSDVTFNHLREVKLEEGTTPEMQFVKLLLAKSPVLVRMLINLHNVKEPARAEILDELSKIKPTSPIAKIDYIV